MRTISLNPPMKQLSKKMILAASPVGIPILFQNEWWLFLL
jgi:hypothetical protein